MVSVLQKFDAAIMIAMRMADDDVLDIGRIETQLSSSHPRFRPVRRSRNRVSIRMIPAEVFTAQALLIFVVSI